MPIAWSPGYTPNGCSHPKLPEACPDCGWYVSSLEPPAEWMDAYFEQEQLVSAEIMRGLNREENRKARERRQKSKELRAHGIDPQTAAHLATDGRYLTMAALQAATNAELLAVPHMGIKRLRHIRNALGQPLGPLTFDENGTLIV